MTHAGCILVVDDDVAIREMLAEYLTSHGFAVALAADGTAMRAQIEAAPPDLVLLDLRLPQEDGLSLARYLRERYDIGIIMVTGASGTVDRIVGLEMGADDYLPKPFNPKELLARIKAVLRRRAPGGPPGAPAAGGVFRFGPFALNLSTRTLTRADQPVSLTTGEFSVLKVLVQHPREPLSRDKLMELARGREYEVFDRSIDVQISRLRKIVEHDPSHPKHIQTVWGFGYVFVPEE
jgi:two-component system phosphate regulon response regulator OmpR